MSKSVVIIGSRGFPSFYGGFETLVRKLAPFLADRDFAVTVYGRPGTTSTRPELVENVRSIETFGFERKSLSTLSYGFTSVLDASVRKPDAALVLNVANGFWLPLLRARNIPTVVNVDGIEWEREKWGHLAKRIFKSGASATARWGDNLVFDSRQLASRWQADFSRGGTFIPYGGTDPGPLASPRPASSRPYVLMVARFVPENTVDQFFAAAERLCKRWDVVIVGSSGYGGEFDTRAAQLAEYHDGIEWLGHLSDDRMLFALWQHAGAYFHGHSVGGTNPALVQAMACGAPTVARDTVFNREVLGDAALYCAPTSSSIAEKLDVLMSDHLLRARLSASAIKRAADEYTWEAVCTAYEHLIVDAIERKK